VTPWTEDEDAVIDWHWGEEALATTAARVGRTVKGVRARLRARGVSSSAMRGKTTVAALADRTGYTWAQVARAVCSAKLRPVHTSSQHRRRALLTEEQCARVVEHLGDETRHAIEQTTVADVAELAEVARNTAWAYAKRLGIRTVFGVLADDDALVLYAALRVACRPQPPRSSRRTIRAVACACGRSRAWAYRVAATPPRIHTGRDGQLSEDDASELRRRLGCG
jgi:hypothetical protein